MLDADLLLYAGLSWLRAVFCEDEGERKEEEKIWGTKGVFCPERSPPRTLAEHYSLADLGRLVVGIGFLELLYGWRGWDSDIWLGRFVKLLRVWVESTHKPLIWLT
jgi:hypothetical protein